MPSRIAGFSHPQANAQRQTQIFLGPVAQLGGIGRTKANGGDRMAALRRIGDVHFHRAIRPPRLDRSPDGAGQQVMASPDVLDAFVVDHVQRGPQPVQVVRGGRAVPIFKKRRRMCAWRPVPIAADTVHPRPRFGGLVAEEHETHARRHHHPLLRSGNHHIDAPFVHLEWVTAQRGHAIRHQQGGMIQIVQHCTQGGNVVLERGRSVHMHRQHGLDLVRLVRRQTFGHAHRINRR